MADKPIKAHRTETFEETRGTAHRIGDVLLETPSGDIVQAKDAPGYSTLTLAYADAGDSRVALLLYDLPQEGEEHGTGMICQITPTEARTIAASLLRLAAKLDPGKPH